MIFRSVISADFRKRRVCRLVFGVCIVLWALQIFAFSAESATESTQTSSSLSDVAFSFYEKIFGTVPSDDAAVIKATVTNFVRKTAHFTIYTVLGIFSSLFAFSFIGGFSRIALSYVGCVLYACSDEVHQYFVPGRAMRFTDVLIDSGGALLGISLVCIVIALCRKKQSVIAKTA